MILVFHNSSRALAHSHPRTLTKYNEWLCNWILSHQNEDPPEMLRRCVAWLSHDVKLHASPNIYDMFFIALINHQHRPDYVLQNFLHVASFFCQAKLSKPQLLAKGKEGVPTNKKHQENYRNYLGSIQFPPWKLQTLNRFSIRIPKQMGVSKNCGYPKMDGENHGNPY